jgi:hypothetical protein
MTSDNLAIYMYSVPGIPVCLELSWGKGQIGVRPVTDPPKTVGKINE